MKYLSIITKIDKRIYEELFKIYTIFVFKKQKIDSKSPESEYGSERY